MLKLQLGDVQSSPCLEPRPRVPDVCAGKEPLSSQPWKRFSSSESEYSDTEGGIQSKVRWLLCPWKHGIHKTLPHHPLCLAKTAEGITFPFDFWDGMRKLEGNNLCWFGIKFVLPLPVLGLKDFLSQPATNTHGRGGAHALSLLFSLIFLFVFKVLPSQCSPRGSGLFPLHYKVNRKESSLWLLVSICSWCPWYWQPPVCVPDDYCSKGPFSKGEALLSTKIVLFPPINLRSCLLWPSVSIWLLPKK